MRKFNVYPSPTFFEDVARHIEFLADFDEMAGRKIEMKFEKSLFPLTNNAMIHSVFYEDFRKVNVGKYHAIFYRVIGEDVFVTRVYDMRSGEFNEMVADFD